METIRGTVSKIRIIKMSASPLVYFKLGETNCLIAAHSLSFLADVAEGSKIVVAGDYNSRKQFVVKKYAVVGMAKIMMEFEMMRI